MRIHPPRYECHSCGHVLRGQEYVDLRVACPVCGGRNGRASWPSPAAQEAIDTLLSREWVSGEEKREKVLLAAIALQDMAAWAGDGSARVAEPAGGETEATVRSWPETLGSRSEKDIDHAAVTVDLPDFLDRWKRLVGVAASIERSAEVADLEEFGNGWLEALVIDGLMVFGEAQNQAAQLRRAS